MASGTPRIQVQSEQNHPKSLLMSHSMGIYGLKNYLDLAGLLEIAMENYRPTGCMK